MDVLEEAVAEGRKSFPQAHWVHFNRYNCSFNPDGIEGLPIPDLEIQFGMILAYSVFTHTTREEMNELVEQLRARLAPGGVLAFTFIDPHFNAWPEVGNGSNLKWRLERAKQMNPRVDIEGLLEQSRGAAWCALVDGAELYVNSNGEWNGKVRTQSCMTYNVFYTVEFLQRDFPSATIRPPVNGEMQHCCIIRRNA
jgi:SAM-dependent methyltransferase